MRIACSLSYRIENLVYFATGAQRIPEQDEQLLYKPLLVKLVA